MRKFIYVLTLLCPGMLFAHIDPQSDCLMNLREIASAKAMFQIEKKLPDGAPCRTEDLPPYLQNKTMPQCRAGGSYTIGPLGTEPTCSIPSHSQAAFDESFRKNNARHPVLTWLCIGAVAFLIALGGYMALHRKAPSGAPSL